MKFLLIACVALTTAAFANSPSSTMKKETKSTTTDVYQDSTMKDHDAMIKDEKQEVIEKTDKTKQKMEDGMDNVKTKKTIEESTTTDEY